jgi:hypothetical protein
MAEKKEQKQPKPKPKAVAEETKKPAKDERKTKESNGMGIGMMVLLILVAVVVVGGLGYLVYVKFVAPEDGGTTGAANLGAGGTTSTTTSAAGSNTTTSAPTKTTTSAPKNTTSAPVNTRPAPPVTTQSPVTCGSGKCPNKVGVWTTGTIMGDLPWGDNPSNSQSDCIRQASLFLSAVNSNNAPWPTLRQKWASQNNGVTNPVSKFYVQYDSSAKHCKWGLICGGGTKNCNNNNIKSTIIKR